MRALSLPSDLRRLLLASTALVLPLAGTHAQNAVWQVAPIVAGLTAGTFDFNAGGNWLPDMVPTGTTRAASR
jgi:hypothetical protein